MITDYARAESVKRYGKVEIETRRELMQREEVVKLGNCRKSVGRKTEGQA